MVYISYYHYSSEFGGKSEISDLNITAEFILDCISLPTLHRNCTSILTGGNLKEMNLKILI